MTDAFQLRFLVKEIADSIFPGKGTEFLNCGWDWIPCMYNGPHHRDGNLKPDNRFFGYEVVRDGNKPRLVVVPGYAVVKAGDGRCLIPDCAENRKILADQKPGTEIYFETVAGKTPGTTKRVQKKRPTPPKYVAIGSSDESLKKMAEAVAEYMSRPEAAKAPALAEA